MQIISAFCLTTNSDTWGYPYIESIKSFLPIVDELIIIDGGSTDSTIDNIKALSSKIRIVNDKDTKWEDVWKYSRMSHNFDRGFQECKGDVVIKFDIDNILLERHEKLLKDDLLKLKESRAYSITFNKRNVQVKNHYYLKKPKTLAVNKRLCKENRINAHYGLDINNWGWGNEAIESKRFKNGIHYGNLLRLQSCMGTNVAIYNYDFIFRSEKNTKELLYRFFRAISLQKGYTSFKDKEHIYKKYCIGRDNNDKGVHRHKLNIEEHPKIIQNKLKKLWLS